MNKLPHICFVTPPSPFLLDERVFPSLGILQVAGVGEALGYGVEHLDLNGVEDYAEVVRQHVMRSRADVYALTATTPQMVAATKIRDEIYTLRPDLPVVLGGPHPTLTYAATKTGSRRAAVAKKRLEERFDVLVAGDGEAAIVPAVAKAVEHSYGWVDADDPKGGLFLTSKQLEDLVLPARHLVDLESYHYAIDGMRVTPLIGQRGCPFGCNFCAGRDSAMLRRVRLRSTEHVIRELRHIYKTHGIHGFMFFDDELNVNRNFDELLLAMMRLQDELGVEFRCRGFVKAELFTEAQGNLMYRAGFRRVMCGFESGSDRILRNINKHATKDDNTRAMEISHKYKLDMKALMSVGHPGESGRSVQETMDWLISVEPKDIDVTIITAYPGSPYYDRAKEAGGGVWVFETNGDRLYMKDIDYTETEDFYKGSLESYKSYVWSDYISADELVWARDKAEREVRGKLGIPFYEAGSVVKVEGFAASMGQLPGQVFRQGREKVYGEQDRHGDTGGTEAVDQHNEEAGGRYQTDTATSV